MLTTSAVARHLKKTESKAKIKLGAKFAVKDTQRVLRSRALFLLSGDVGELVYVLTPYLLGNKWDDHMVLESRIILGRIGVDLIRAAKIMKVKVPGLGKRIKLKGTRSAALLELMTVTHDLAAINAESMLPSVNVIKEKRTVVLPSKGGQKVVREVSVVDKDKEEVDEAERISIFYPALETAVTLYWGLCYSILGESPEGVVSATLGN
jgi:hypothetical protein